MQMRVMLGGLPSSTPEVFMGSGKESPAPAFGCPAQSQLRLVLSAPGGEDTSPVLTLPQPGLACVGEEAPARQNGADLAAQTPPAPQLCALNGNTACPPPAAGRTRFRFRLKLFRAGPVLYSVSRRAHRALISVTFEDPRNVINTGVIQPARCMSPSQRGEAPAELRLANLGGSFPPKRSTRALRPSGSLWGGAGRSAGGTAGPGGCGAAHRCRGPAPGASPVPELLARLGTSAVSWLAVGDDCLAASSPVEKAHPI